MKLKIRKNKGIARKFFEHFKYTANSEARYKTCNNILERLILARYEYASILTKNSLNNKYQYRTESSVQNNIYLHKVETLHEKKCSEYFVLKKHDFGTKKKDNLNY